MQIVQLLKGFNKWFIFIQLFLEKDLNKAKDAIEELIPEVTFEDDLMLFQRLINLLKNRYHFYVILMILT